MAKTPKPTNFEYLDPEAPRTKRIIEAALTVNVPWHPDQEAPVFEPSKIDAPPRKQLRGLHVGRDRGCNVTLSILVKEFELGIRKMRRHEIERWCPPQ